MKLYIKMYIYISMCIYISIYIYISFLCILYNSFLKLLQMHPLPTKNDSKWHQRRQRRDTGVNHRTDDTHGDLKVSRSGLGCPGSNKWLVNGL